MLTIVICLVVIGMACVAVLRITLGDEKQPATTPRQRHRAVVPESAPASARQVLFDVTDLDDRSPRTNGSLPAPVQEQAGEVGSLAEPTTRLAPEPTAEIPHADLPTTEVPAVGKAVPDDTDATDVTDAAEVEEAPAPVEPPTADAPSPTVALQPDAALTVAIPVAEPAAEPSPPAAPTSDRPVVPPDPRTPFGGMALPDVDTPTGAAIGWPDDLDDDEPDGGPEHVGPVDVTAVVEPPPDTHRFEPPAPDEVSPPLRRHPTARVQAPVPAGGGSVATATRPSTTMFDDADDRRPVVLTTVASTQRLRSTMALVITLTLVGALVAVVLMAVLAAMYLGARSAIVG